jgi:hypothetical protein
MISSSRSHQGKIWQQILVRDIKEFREPLRYWEFHPDGVVGKCDDD